MNELIAKLQKSGAMFAEDLAKQLCKVQPMDTSLWRDLFEHARDEKELIAAGYKPVSEFKLLWIK